MSTSSPLFRKDALFRVSKVVSHLSAIPVKNELDYVGSYRKRLLKCKKELWALIDRLSCNAILVRLAFHDSATFDRAIQQWPDCGGANGSIHFKAELKHDANHGLWKAVEFLKPIKEKFMDITWADLIQLASVTAIQHLGGPVIPVRFGRVDALKETQCALEGYLPGDVPPFADGSPNAAVHLRRVFYRMGFCDREIVALSGVHTIGRGFKLAFDAEFSELDKESTVDNETLQRLSTEQILDVDPVFREFQHLYAKDKAAFFVDYSKAHAKLSELGAKFTPKQGFYL